MLEANCGAKHPSARPAPPALREDLLPPCPPGPCMEESWCFLRDTAGLWAPSALLCWQKQEN